MAAESSKSMMKQVKDESFQPLEQANIKLDKIDGLHNNIGDIEYTSLLSLAKVNVTRCHIPLVGQESLPDNSLVPLTPSCNLTPLDNGVRC